MQILKGELLRELKLTPIDPPKSPEDRTMTRDFMVYLFRILYTYQTIAREVQKEEIFEQRIQLLQQKKYGEYQDLLANRTVAFQDIQSEIKEFVFDYFNIITKEYELSYERWKKDSVYQDEITGIKQLVDREYVESKFAEVPKELTKEKTMAIVKEKQEVVNNILMQMIKGQRPNAQGQVMIGQRELVFELAKFDDEIFIREGFRKDQIDKAIEFYGIDKEEAAARDEELNEKEEMFLDEASSPARGPGAAPQVQSNEEGLKPSGKTLILS